MSKPSPLYDHFQGRLRFLHDGQVIPPAAYCDSIMHSGLEPWRTRVAEFVPHGVKIHILNCIAPPGMEYHDSDFWGDNDTFAAAESDFPVNLDHQAEAILKMCPDARFLIRTGKICGPKAWLTQDPGQIQTDDEGKLHRCATLASQKYLDGLTRSLTNWVNFCESRPWAKHIFAYMTIPYGEGVMPLNIAGKMFDCSASNQAAFTQWIREKYGNEAALRAAWGRDDLTFDNVRIPRDSDWIARRTRGQPTLGGKPLDSKSQASNGGVNGRGLFHWIEAANAADVIDYCHFMRGNFHRWVRTQSAAIKDPLAKLGRQRMFGLDIGKQPLMGWQILLSFDGIGDGQTFPNMLPLSGSWDIGGLLDDPSIDYLMTPADYHARTVGFAYECEGPADAMVLRGKAFTLENDARTWVGAGVGDQGAFRDVPEVQAGLLRNEALNLSRGFNSYWCNIGSSYFHDPKIHDVVAQITPMIQRSAQRPHLETRDAIAMIVDDASALYEDFTSGYQLLSVVWQRVLGMAHCGIPYRIFLLSDLEKPNFPRYKTYLFPNLFKVDDATISLLKSKVLRDGNLAIFGPATGITDGKHLTAEPASRLLGVPLELHARTTTRWVIAQDPPLSAGHPITQALPASFTYGDSLPYGPTMTPIDRGVENNGGIVLGHANLCWFIHRAGLFIKEFGRGFAGPAKPGGAPASGAGATARGEGDYGVLWTAAMPMPAALLRAAARHAGSHIWCEEDDVVYASESFAALHSVKSGRRTLKLPRAMTVRDAVTNEVIGKNMSEVTFNVTPPFTRAFELD